MRQNKNMIKFLISWFDPRAFSTAKKYMFTWISFDLSTNQVVNDISNCEGPKYGLYATFLVGVPTNVELANGKMGSHYVNLNESIVCLD